MELLNRNNSELHGASERLVIALNDSGYISDKDKQELLYRIKTGDRQVYRHIRSLLIAIAEKIGRI